MSDPAAAAKAQYGTVGRVAQVDRQKLAAEESRLDEIADLRSRINEELERRDAASAAALYEQLFAKDPRQCLSERHQLEIAREFYGTGRSPQAAAAFDRFVDCYPRSSEASNVRLLLGIIYARDLRQFETADRYLTESMEALRDEGRRSQCLQWLSTVRAALGRPAPGV